MNSRITHTIPGPSASFWNEWHLSVLVQCLDFPALHEIKAHWVLEKLEPEQTYALQVFVEDIPRPDDLLSWAITHDLALVCQHKDGHLTNIPLPLAVELHSNKQ